MRHAQRLPVRLIPELRHVTAVRLDVVNHRRCGDAPFGLAVAAQRMRLQVPLTRPAPGRAIAALCGRLQGAPGVRAVLPLRDAQRQRGGHARGQRCDLRHGEGKRPTAPGSGQEQSVGDPEAAGARDLPIAGGACDIAKTRREESR